MDYVNARVMNIEDNHFIEIDIEPLVRIPISSDEPNHVKNAFSTILTKLRKGFFQINLLEEPQQNLFYLVAVEYIGQLNTELTEVYHELERHGFVEEKQI